MVSSMDARGPIDRASDIGHLQRTSGAIDCFIEGHQGAQSMVSSMDARGTIGRSSHELDIDVHLHD